MNTSSPQRFDGLADRYASSEVHTSSPALNRLHELLPQVESVCDVASGAGCLPLILLIGIIAFVINFR